MVFQVSDTACASSKKRRGNSEDDCAGAGALAKEFMVVPMGGMPCCMAEKEAAEPPLVILMRERFNGEAAFNESIDVAGDTPFDNPDRRLLFYVGSTSACTTTTL